MKIAVLIKQIPDPVAPMYLDADFRLDRTGKLLLDEADTYGIETALQLIESQGSQGDGEVVVFSVAPKSGISGIRSALALGASRAVLISDESIAGSDALSTAKVLAAAIKRESFDLVIAATESTDGYSGIMPVQLAELLEFPSITFVRKVEIVKDTIVAECQTEQGYDKIEVRLPALITVTAKSVEPRYPSFKGIMAAKTKPCLELGLVDLGLTPDDVGSLGARQRVVGIESLPQRESGFIIEDSGDAYLKILDFLEQLKLI